MCLTLPFYHLACSLASSCVSTRVLLQARACMPLCCALLLFKVHSSCPEGSHCWDYSTSVSLSLHLSFHGWA